MIRIKNWKKHQHYKGRTPPWIKLHAALLDDYDFERLPDGSKLQLVALWLLASRSREYHPDGDPLLPHDEAYLTKKSGLKSKMDLKTLISSGFIVRYQSASNPLDDRKQSVPAETEAYKEETEADKKKIVRFAPPSLEEVIEYCKQRNNNVDPVKFHSHYTANGWKVGRGGLPMRNWKAAVVSTWEK